MATAFNTRKRIRRFFGHIESVAPMPNLIEVQKSSYENFLQRTIAAAKRTPSGLQEVFRGCPVMKDGSLYANDAPGWGIEVDEKLAAKYPYGSFESEERKRLNGGWGEVRRRDGSIIKQ